MAAPRALFVFLALLAVTLAQQPEGHVETSVVLKSILENYDPASRPNLENNTPVRVELQLRVNHLYNIDSKFNTYVLDTFIRLRWIDERLTYNSTWRDYIRVNPASLWKPDIITYNSIDVKGTAETVTVQPDGMVFWSRQQLLTLSSTLDLHSFPFDSQSLEAIFMSFSFDNNDLILTPFNLTRPFDPDPASNYDSPIWAMTSTSFKQDNILLRNTEGPHSAVRVYFNLTRRHENYIVKYILPLAFLVLLSQLSYWIDPMSPPARVGSSFTLVLAVVTFNVTVGNELPKLNYLTLMDWYVITCFLFAFLSVVEYAAVNHFMYKPSTDAKAIGRRIDYFFKYSAGPLWILVVALFFLQHQLTQIIMYSFASVWLAAGSLLIGSDVYKAVRDRPTCVRIRSRAAQCWDSARGKKQDGELALIPEDRRDNDF
eukprot:m.230595 g.230595  ORF g.230595 m.230595 type:complete len:429 (-) comp18088_c0_seq1:56-1342(-)